MPEVYDPIPALDRSAIEGALENNDSDELMIAVLSAALYSEDRDFAQELCIRLAGHVHFNVRGNAVLGFAHIARIDGRLDEERVRPLVLKGLNDLHEYVRGQAQDTRDDIEQHLGWKF